jgi:putative membrane protein
MRGRYLRARPPLGPEDLDRLFAADNLWGGAALLWIGTGLARAFGGLEKGTDFYVHSTLFWIKLGLFGAVFALEIRPMATLIRWRIARGRGQPLARADDPAFLASLARGNDAQIALTLAIPFVASFMARGY